MSEVLSYNNVQLTFLQLRRWEQMPIAVGQDIAGFRYTATILANLNTNTFGSPTAAPTVSAASLAGIIGAAAGGPLAATGFIATSAFAGGMELWTRLRELLLQQRKPFRWVLGPLVIADVAGAASGFQPDIELGPKPLSCNAIQFNGSGSVLVEYTIQWAIGACPNGRTTANTQTTLAHVWAVDEDIDSDWFQTRIYKGRIHFDPTVVGPAGVIHPDLLRGAFFPPLSPDMRRVDIKTKMKEDGYTYDYLITDRQPHQLVNSTQVTRLTATHSVKQRTPTGRETSQILGGLARSVAAKARALAEKGGNIVSLTKLPDILKSLATTAVGAAADAVDLSTEVIDATWALTPVATHTFQADAYGHNASDYVALARAARVVCLWRLMKLMPVGISGDWGGESETQNYSEPRRVTFTLNVHARPRYLYNWNLSGVLSSILSGVVAGNPAGETNIWNKVEIPGIWDSGQNLMPTLPPGLVPPPLPGQPSVPPNLTNVPITGPGGAAIPLHIKQLFYGGTPGVAATDWNGTSTPVGLGLAGGIGVGVTGIDNSSFAPDLLGVRDARQQPTFYNGTAIPTGSSLQLSLVAALQDVCSSVKKAVIFPQNALTTFTPGTLKTS